MGGRSHSLSCGGLEGGFNRVSTPLAYTNPHAASHNPAALHSAPYDLGFAYSSGLEGPAPVVQPPIATRTGYDRSTFLQGWGGMNACDFSGGRY